MSARTTTPSRPRVSFRGKHVLVTGAQGLVGSSLSVALSHVDCRLTLLDRDTSRAWMDARPRADCHFASADITDPATWRDCLAGGVDVVFHLAAMEYDRKNFDARRDYEVNARSMIALMDACRELARPPLIVFSSSANVCGSRANGYSDEHLADNPTSLWSVHKLTAEWYLRVYSRRYAMPAVVLRLANVYGLPARRDVFCRSMLNLVMQNAVAGRGLVLFPNRNKVRDYIHVDDVVDAFMRVPAVPRGLQDGRHFILATGQAVTIGAAWRLIAATVGKTVGRKVPVECREVAMEPLDNRSFAGSSRLFTRHTGWRPRVCLRDGVARTVETLFAEMRSGLHVKKNERGANVEEGNTA